MSQYSPHLIGFACWSLARKTFGLEPWPRHLATGLHCSAADIDPPARDLAELRIKIESNPVQCPLLKKQVFVMIIITMVFGRISPFVYVHYPTGTWMVAMIQPS